MRYCRPRAKAGGDANFAGLEEGRLPLPTSSNQHPLASARPRPRPQVGGDANFAGLEEARRDLVARVMNDVLGPLDQWRESLRLVEVCLWVHARARVGGGPWVQALVWLHGRVCVLGV